MLISAYRTLRQRILSECGLLIHGQGDETLPGKPSNTVSLTHARIIDNQKLAAI